jgi:uncharacterized DUF497 family protein
MNARIVFDFEWDDAKALTNKAKHGVTFDQAATVFLDALALTVYDEAHSEFEERWFTLGQDTESVLVAVSHTYRITGPASACLRIISARKATPRERRFYEEEPR